MSSVVGIAVGGTRGTVSSTGGLNVPVGGIQVGSPPPHPRHLPVVIHDRRWQCLWRQFIPVPEAEEVPGPGGDVVGTDAADTEPPRSLPPRQLQCPDPLAGMTMIARRRAPVSRVNRS